MLNEVIQKRHRADGYRFLSACFCLPQKKFFLEEDLFGRLGVALKETCMEAVPFLTEMEKVFRETEEEDLKVEYARLFVGPYELQAPPYGSIYLDKERQLMGASTFEVIMFYQQAGLAMEHDLREPPDHIAIELEFMSYLISREADFLEKADTMNAQKVQHLSTQFFKKCLSPWVFPFCQKMKEATDHSFYTSLANCLFTFIGNQKD